MRYLSALLCAILMAPAAVAGDLTPPGAPGPTMKTLDQVEPRVPIGPLTTPGNSASVYRITRPGSYYLTGDVAGGASQSGITILASDVTVDLMGFAVVGAPSAIAGVTTSGTGLGRITVKNGVVRDWGLWGVNLNAATNSAVVNCIASNNANQGILVGEYSEAARCRAVGNGDSGIQAGQYSLVRDVVATDNGANGVSLGSHGVIRDSVLSKNGASGLVSGTGATISGCSAVQNGLYGFSSTGAANISHCTSAFNQSAGFSIGFSSTISECTAYANTGDGIVGSTHNRISRNVCSFAGSGGDGAGIHVTFGDNAIVDNAVTNSDRGVDADSAGNFIARNTASGNAVNFAIAAGNVCFVVSATTSAAINGSSGGVSPGSTDPNANYAY